MKKLIVGVLLCLPLQAFAVKVAGVNVPDGAQVESRQLQLNGAGVRTVMMFKVYVAALYLENKKKTANDVLADTGVKRVELHVLRQLTAGKFMEAFNKAINENHTPEEYIPLAARLIRFSRAFREVGEVNPGDTITLDLTPAGETILRVSGKEHARIKGADFYRGLLRIWMGRNPVSDDLKKDMLGG